MRRAILPNIEANLHLSLEALASCQFGVRRHYRLQRLASVIVVRQVRDLWFIGGISRYGQRGKNDDNPEHVSPRFPAGRR